jgi:hypothetical protein
LKGFSLKGFFKSFKPIGIYRSWKVCEFKVFCTLYVDWLIQSCKLCQIGFTLTSLIAMFSHTIFMLIFLYCNRSKNFQIVFGNSNINMVHIAKLNLFKWTNILKGWNANHNLKIYSFHKLEVAITNKVFFSHVVEFAKLIRTWQNLFLNVNQGHSCL